MAAEEPKVALARARAEAARLRFLASVQHAKARVSPGALADQAKAAVVDKSETLADNAGRFVRKKPAVAGGVAAAGLLFLVRKPIARLFRRKPRE